MAAGSDQITASVQKNGNAQVANFGCNGAFPQTAVTLPANATDLATAQTLVNAIKAALIACGICA